LYKSYQAANIAGQIMFIYWQMEKRWKHLLQTGKIISLLRQRSYQNVPPLFFTLDPDEKVIDANIGKALYLADESAKNQYNDLKEKSYYNNLISGNISQQVTVDSIQLDINQYPYYFKCFATQKLIRSTSTANRSLITQGYLRNVARSDNNPHGFLILHWETLANRDTTIQH
jgi:conjugative transposon TraK protein